MSFLYEIVEHKKDAHEYVMITGFEGNTSNLVVPGEIEGLPVEAIGNHAFSGREDLISVSLPGSIKTLYGFAFHDCRKLKKISLHDSIDDYYDGVCRQCDSLTDIEMVMDRGWYEVVRNFLADNDRTLRFKLLSGHDRADAVGTLYGETICLTFPEYVYDFNENTMARTIQFSIAGSGMFYRECVDRRNIDFRQYDRLFEKALIDGGEIAENIALGRLLYPVELADENRSMYEEFVRKNADSILKRFIESSVSEPESKDTLKDMFGYGSAGTLVPESALDKAIRLATSKGLTEVSAILMNSGKTQGGSAGVFEL